MHRDNRCMYMVSSCTLLNCVTINMIYRPTLLQDILHTVTDLFCF